MAYLEHGELAVGDLDIGAIPSNQQGRIEKGTPIDGNIGAVVQSDAIGALGHGSEKVA